METIRTYKLLRRDEVGLHPLFIDTPRVLPIGEWLEAFAPNDIALSYIVPGYALIDMKTQALCHYRERKPTPHMVRYASQRFMRWVECKDGMRGRKVYDLGIGTNGQVLRFAHRPGWHSSLTPSLPAVNMEGKVWAECEIPADDYYTLHRNISGLSKTHEPIDWLISNKIKIVRVMDGLE